MESSQNVGVSEECHSSESGWTMYIGSPVDDSSDGDEDDDVEYGKNKGFHANHQDDSDDSMASDASSGPSHQPDHPFAGHGSMKHQKPLMEKHRAERKEVKDKLVLVGQKPKSSVQSSSKVRKSIWMGKRN
ncbi:uncharacterized protein LOC111472737 [Cucurbita maxima]|uniref:Uncharacterized protein LOC111472737 n=1 Tax=Cucurbita maxima TaxID=3661 RepID=A0A6J1IGR2_CUCMA|nr:uncharacterized protein LOC111472737 [Cucurbita maxima]